MEMSRIAVLVSCSCLFTYSSTAFLNEKWVTESPMPLSSAPAPPLTRETPTVPATNFTAKESAGVGNGTTHHPGNATRKSTTIDDTDEYYSAYPDYPDPINSSGSVLPEPEVSPLESEEPVPLPDDSLADTDLHDHDLIDSVMYIYFGGSNRDRGPAGRQVLIVGAVMALVAQFLTLAGAFKRLKTEDSALVILLNTELALTCSNLLFMLGVQATSDKWTCEMIAIALHYLHLVTASWFCANCFHSYWKLSRPAHKPRILFYTLASWLFPALVVYISTVVNFQGYEACHYCWMSVERGILILFMLPISALMIANTILVVIGLKMANKWHLESEPERKSLRVAASLLPMFSVVWFLSVVALDNSRSLVFPLLYVASNAFLNWFVFIWWLPGETGSWREGDEEYEDDFEEELLYEDQHCNTNSSKEELAQQEQLYLIGPRDNYELQMEPICTISS
ncbi:latrophilin Cirl-like isoform X2 [Cimex lectularius]|uniref:G-protein coupled receptors family 2 profile 2 domain-containing protein n=1 Tax=Cimex lectularius TaxID=79782 RepID=A0A8I6SHX8_CIMLE|nr:latrophilin Cirl-like isoform X2 [Cimex lectularius]